MDVDIALDLIIKVVNGTSGENPISGGSTAVSAAQTSDFSFLVILGFLMLCLAGCLFFIRKKHALQNAVVPNHSVSKNICVCEIDFASKIIIAVMSLVACGCLIFGFNTVPKAFAQGELQPDKNVINAVFNDDGSLTLDSCQLTNVTDNKISINKAKVSVVDAVADVEGINDTWIKICGFDGVVFDYTPSDNFRDAKDLSPIESGDSTNFSFNLDFVSTDVIYSIVDKECFSVSLQGKVEPKAYTVTLNNGEDATPQFETLENVVYGEPMPTVAPLPENPGYIFLGYFDGEDDTAKQYIDKNGDSLTTWDKEIENPVLYAHWEDGPFDGLTFTVDADQSAKIFVAKGRKASQSDELPNFWYSFTGEKDDWTEFIYDKSQGTLSERIILNNDNPKVYFKGLNPDGIADKAGIIIRSENNIGCVTASGNINSLLDGNRGHSIKGMLPSHCYESLFCTLNSFGSLAESSNGLKTAPSMPNNDLSEWSFANMFMGSYIEQCPDLPYENLADHCFDHMFELCRKITSGPQLNSMHLADSCYKGMFANSSIVNHPALPANDLCENCYCEMFYKCLSLASAINLPAQNLASGCYKSMYEYCTSLSVDDLVLSASIMQPYCYESMFERCGIGNCVIELSSQQLAEGCYKGMFSNSGIEKSPVLPATDLADYCYCSMFSGSQIKYAPALPATTMKIGCYDNMFSGCNKFGIYQGPPDLSHVDTLAKSCFKGMFSGDFNMRNFPSDLNATKAEESCYESMFALVHLRSVPKIKLNVTAKNCCKYMFDGRGGHGTYIDDFSNIELMADEASESCYEGMFIEQTSLKIPPKINMSVFKASCCCKDMFNGCSSLYITDSASIEKGVEFFTAPETIDVEDAFKDMFKGTCGTEEGVVVEAGKTYYWYPNSEDNSFVSEI